MESITYVAYLALFIGIWHELSRFPAANRSFHKVQEKLEQLQSDNYDLKRNVESLEYQVQVLSEKVNRIDDPELSSAFELGDPDIIVDLLKKRGMV